ncbi:MAG: YbgC/FadM family acyl-CoA thioesterase [Nitrospirae bacterium]|nr:MAG: YbgC/FadM family acyl-CoA thioesterase [Nitrospirota bacterium]
MTAHIHKVRIYYEDTDCGGVVYYANYLRYLERARTEFLEAAGASLKGLMDEGVFFVVAEAALKYRAPGRYGDILVISTVVEKTGPASIVFRHSVGREGTKEELVEASVKLGCVGKDMKPMRLPDEIRRAVSSI